MPKLLTTASTVMCPHGGKVVFSSSKSKVKASEASLLLENETHQVVGCPFTVGSKYSPCVSVKWSGGASKVKVGKYALLTEASMGKCENAEKAFQGTAVVANTPTNVDSV
ncbi:MAG: hypothetical protein AAGA18_13830 [Verrucomicrobiota bacterium]